MLIKLLKKASVLMAAVILLELFYCVPVSALSEYRINTAEYSVSEIIVKYKETNHQLQKGKSRHSSEYIVKKSIDTFNIEIIDVLSVNKMEDAIKLYGSDPNVEYAVPNDRITAYNYSEEPLFENQWGLGENGINIEQSYGYSDGGDIIVGVMDTGIDTVHPDLAENIMSDGWDFVNNDSSVFDTGESPHGTNIAGIIAASVNKTGIAGAAPRAKILPLKILDGETGYVSDAIQAIEYAKTKGVKIMNCSWGTESFNLALKDVIKNSDMLFVCATGNNGINTETYPAAFELGNIIAVGACDSAGKVAAFTNSRQTLDLYAPGVDILTTSPGGAYTTVSGTSFSAAFVTGIAALTLQAVPSLTACETAIVLSESGRSENENGIRIADAAKAIRLALPIGFMKDSDSRLTRIMNDANLLITPDIADILTRYDHYNLLTEGEKNTINSFFGINGSDMEYCLEAGIALIDSIASLLNAQKVDITANQVVALLNHYADNDILDSEIDNLRDIIKRINLSASEKNEMISCMLGGYTTIRIAGAFIFAKVANLPLSQAIGKNGTVLQPDESTLTGEERETFRQIIEQYMINPTAADAFLKQNDLTAADLSDLLYKWQKRNHFFVYGDRVSSYSLSSQDSSLFGKYEYHTSDVWSNGNAVIDKTNGMLSYTYPLLTLAGKNGLDLNLGLRFDPESADIITNVKAPDSLNVSYTVTEKRTFYSEDLSQRLPELDCEYVYIKTDYSDIENDIAQDGMCFTASVDSTEVCYYKNVRVTAQYDNSDYADANRENYYDSLYSMGIGWSLTFPSLEMIGSAKYLHLPDGTKYKINADNTLEGYLLSDLSFQPDSSFTTDNQDLFLPSGIVLPDISDADAVSAFSLSELSGVKHYFNQSGKYIGSSDTANNSILVSYSSGGRIEKIIDSADREICFSYQETASVRTVDITVSKRNSNERKTLYTITQTKNDEQKYELTGITDGTNRSTVFAYNTYDKGITLNETAVPDSGKGIYLSAVTSPAGVKTEFAYTRKSKKYGVAGTENYYAVNAAADINGSVQKNAVSYQTPNLRLMQYPSGTVYPCADISRSDYCRSERVVDNRKEATFYNDFRIPCRIQTWDSSDNTLKSERETVSFDSYYQPTEIDERIYSDSGAYSLVKTVLQWDAFGNCLSKEVRSGSQDGLSVNIDEKIVTSYFSDTDIPSVKIEYSYKKEGEYYAQKTVNTILPLLKKISKTEVYSCSISGTETTNDKLLYYYDYGYDSAGQLIQNKTTYAEDNQPLTSANSAVRIKEIVYDPDYGVYPVQTKTFGRYRDTDGNYADGIKDADGRFLTNADGKNIVYETSSNYNILGQTLSTQTADNIKKVYTYDSSTNELSKTEYFNGDTKLGEETVRIDYTSNTVTHVSFDGVGTKTQYDSFGNVIKTYRQTEESIGRAAPVYMLIEKNVYDEYQRITDTYTLLSEVPEQDEDLNAQGVKYIKTNTSYDAAGRVSKVSITDREGNIVSSPVEYEYESGVEYGETGNIYNTVSKTVQSGNAYNEIFSTTQYLDSYGRLRMEEYYNGGTKLYTNQYTYSDFGYLSASGGETVNNTKSAEYPEDNSTVISHGVAVNSDGTSAEVTAAEVTDGLGQKIQTVDGNGGTTYYKYDILGRLIDVKAPADKIGQTVYYCETKTYYDKNGNVSEEKKQINNIGEAIRFSSVKMQYDVFGRTVLVSENTDDSGRCALTQYYYEGKNASPSRVYTGQSTALTIAGLDDLLNTGYYVNTGNHFIMGIKENTAVQDFCRKLSEGFGASVVRRDAGEEVIAGNIATGDTVELVSEGGNNIYTAVVTADINNDGNTDIRDLIRIKKYLAEMTGLDAAQSMAAELDGSGTVGTGDMVMLRKRLLGTCVDLPLVPLPEYSVQSYCYDTAGNITQYTDALGNSDYFEYDAFTGKLVQKTLRNGKTISFEYDPAGNLLKTAGSEKGKISEEYSYEYDLLGNLLKVSDKSGSIANSYEYDNLNRLIEAYSDYGDLKIQTAYLYTGKDLAEMTTARFDSSGMGSTAAKEKYTYNETGDITVKNVEIYTGNFLNETLKYHTEYTYGYDADGNLKYTTSDCAYDSISCGQFSAYTYGMNNLVKKIRTTKEAGATYKISMREENYTYSTDGKLVNKQINVERNEDEEVYEPEIRSFYTNYEYAANGALISEEYGKNINNSSTPIGKTAYAYDSSGNRISERKTDCLNAQNSSYVSYTYNSANRLETRTESAGDYSSLTVYRYDLSGNLLESNQTKTQSGINSYENTAYSYDSLNRTSSITKNGVTVGFAYDENNRRISKTAGNTKTVFAWNGENELYEVNYENPEQYNYYIWGIGGEAEGVIKNGRVYSNTLDVSGNVVNSVNLNENTEQETQYDAFGNITGGQPASSVGYSGEYMDSETGLYYLNARFYDPESGRFTQEDSWLSEGPNLYIYANNNPVMYSDPSGHCSAIDLAYQRKLGNMSAVRKLKTLTANMQCDPQYHYDPNEISKDYLIPDNLLYWMDTQIKRAQLNLRHNMKYNISGLIYNQNYGDVAKLRYGAKTMDFNGCELIAIYNAAYLLGYPLGIQNIAYEMEYYGIWLDGYFGTHPTSIGSYMSSKGFKVKTISKESLNSCTTKGTVFIISFFNSGYNPFSGIHTIAILCNGKKSFTMYNRWFDSNENDAPAKNIDEILRGGGWVIGYKISI